MYAVFSDGDLQFSSLSREGSLRAQVTEAIRAALISGRMRPGTLYSAPVLAEMLGVSATPVREAMLDLAKEGLVQVARNKGFLVTAVSERQLDEMAATRLLLEVPTMGAVAESYGPAMDDELTRLRDVARDLESAAENDELIAYMRLDTEFHARFLALHGNSEIVSIVRQLRGRSRLYGLEALARSGRLVQTTREHMRMIDLAVARDRAGLEELTRTHLTHTRTTWADAGST
ncbi:GntR family transcriptional regulator [Pseudonocardia nematodicida]|uniref:GntR family transcriptional regulator n=1 Tax=Pseudonocardia nematodicida TaxID=1206997 RepID=A0ABV1K6V8_9PSEU